MHMPRAIFALLFPNREFPHSIRHSRAENQLQACDEMFDAAVDALSEARWMSKRSL